MTRPTVIARCSDIMKLPPDAAARCDMMFTDPPWGQGPLRMFETMMKKAGYEPPANAIEDVIHRMFQLAPKARPLFVEYGVKTNPGQVIQIAHMYGHLLTGTRAGTQLNGDPFITLQFNSDMPDPGPYRGYELMRKALEYHRTSWVFEPFAGIGRHTTEIAKCGVSVVASELNPERYNRLLNAASAVATVQVIR